MIVTAARLIPTAGCLLSLGNAQYILHKVDEACHVATVVDWPRGSYYSQGGVYASHTSKLNM